MHVRYATEYDAASWDDYVSRNPLGNPYLLWAWGRAIKQVYGHAVHNLCAVDSTGGMIGILPLVHFRHFLFGSRLYSMPYADLGGVAADNDEVERALIHSAANIAAENKVSTLELRQGDAPVSTMRMDAHGYRLHAGATDKVRMLLDLPVSQKNLMASFKAKLRSQIRRPQKEGLKVTSGGVELVDPAYRVFAENMRDLGSPVHAREFISAVMTEFSNRSRIFLVSKGDDVFACAVVLGCGRTLYNPWASSLRRFSASSPNMMLYWAMLEYGCEQGYACFDFGRSTPNEGTYRFKKQWGAVDHPLHWCRLTKTETNNGKQDAMSGPTHNLRRTFARMWGCLPLCVANRFGPILRKHIAL